MGNTFEKNTITYQDKRLLIKSKNYSNKILYDKKKHIKRTTLKISTIAPFQMYSFPSNKLNMPHQFFIHFSRKTLRNVANLILLYIINVCGAILPKEINFERKCGMLDCAISYLTIFSQFLIYLFCHILF